MINACKFRERLRKGHVHSNKTLLGQCAVNQHQHFCDNAIPYEYQRTKR